MKHIDIFKDWTPEMIDTWLDIDIESRNLKTKKKETKEKELKSTNSKQSKEQKKAS